MLLNDKLIIYFFDENFEFPEGTLMAHKLWVISYDSTLGSETATETSCSS